MDFEQKQNLRNYRNLMSEADQLYALFQKKSGLSDAEYWSLFAVRAEGCRYQHEICERTYMSRQTVNSALKQLVKKGYVQLAVPKENQRIKEIILTAEGEAFVRKYVDIVHDLEARSWARLEKEEQRALRCISEKMNRIFGEEISRALEG